MRPLGKIYGRAAESLWEFLSFQGLHFALAVQINRHSLGACFLPAEAAFCVIEAHPPNI
jgi:hypothetical protein